MSDLIQTTKDWNEYWGQKNTGGKLYGIVAEFYRKRIIRPTLNYFTRKYFSEGAHLLHAGCGTGQVDIDIRRQFSITGVDISSAALRIYQDTNGDLCQSLQASILDLGLPASSVDGIYNLGVMEHFTAEDIDRILAEFKRVLRSGGRVVLFWPPEYGLSVLFFKVLRGLCKLFLNKDVKFHPDEISRVQSKKATFEVLKKNGYRPLEFSFGPRDLFTYAIVVAEKP